jgi:hypothetical protein
MKPTPVPARSLTTESRAAQRSNAFAASTRNARVFGKIAGVFILLMGSVCGALLSGFGVWTPHVSFMSIALALVAAVGISWIGAVLLETPPLAAMLFAIPLAAGMAFTIASRQWGSCAVLFGAMVIPFAALALYKFDLRKPDQRRA